MDLRTLTSAQRNEIAKMNSEFTLDILRTLEGKKLQSLKNALDRNLYLTSSYVLSQGEMEVYVEGWYVKLEGTRTSFSVFAYDRDGEFEIAARKPQNLRLLYKTPIYFDESCYTEFL